MLHCRVWSMQEKVSIQQTNAQTITNAQCSADHNSDGTKYLLKPKEVIIDCSLAKYQTT